MRWLLTPVFKGGDERANFYRGTAILYAIWCVQGFVTEMNGWLFWLGCFLIIIGDLIIFVAQKEDGGEAS